MQAVCARSVLMLTHEFARMGVEWSLDLELHESLVQRARNSLTHRMLKSQATHLLFIDADVEFRPLDVIGMLGADKPLVCGAYPKKTLDVGNIAKAVQRGDADPMAHAANYAINVLPPKDGGAEVTLNATDLCVPILDAPTGFMLVQRDVLLQLAAAHPESLYYSDQGQTRGEAIHALFDCAIVEGRYLSEDYLFSRRWQNLGGTVWLFLPAKLGHVGSYTYRGDLFTMFQPVVPTSEYSLPEEQTNPDYAALMVERYEWAAARVKGKRIADACCGPGYGMPTLARNGAYVMGFDRAEENARTAHKRGFGVVFVDDVTGRLFTSFDAVVSIETIEHLVDPWAWLAGFSDSVKELMISCPCVPTKHVNKWHLHDIGYQELIDRVTAMGWTVKEHEMQRDDVIMLYAVRA